MIIDCHAHLVPPSLLDAIRSDAQGFPSIRLIEDGGSLGFSFAGGKPTRPVSRPLSDLPARMKWMDEQKIERQVVGGWLDMFGYEAAGGRGREMVAPDQHASGADRQQRAALRAARDRSAAGRRAGGRGAARGACHRLSRAR